MILKKKRKQEHSPGEISEFVNRFTKGDIPDYQMSSWLMAVCFNGLTAKEVSELTLTMRDSGKKLNFSHLTYTVDKHSTGGVGDKTSLILGPIVAAAGAFVPMIAGRGLGHTGGTLDKLESLPGFNIQLTESQFIKQVSELGLAIMGQTLDICPADRKLYALRDVTGTVDSLDLICGSIMSKKLAEGIRGLVLDVKFGSGAFMKTLPEAEALAHLLKRTGEANGLDVRVVYSNMDQPLGRFIGNGLEVKECLEIMKNLSFVEDGHDYYSSTRDLSLILAGYMLFLAKKAANPEDGIQLASSILKKGLAYEKFEQICKAQGCLELKPQTEAKHKFAVLAEEAGYVSKINGEALGFCAIELGAGRLKTSDKIDASAGIEMNCFLGQKIQKGHALAYLYTNQPDKLNSASTLLLRSISISSKALNAPPLIEKVI
jgi:pyrimidine-nucleoside phosphorylase